MRKTTSTRMPRHILHKRHISSSASANPYLSTACLTHSGKSSINPYSAEPKETPNNTSSPSIKTLSVKNKRPSQHRMPNRLTRRIADAHAASALKNHAKTTIRITQATSNKKHDTLSKRISKYNTPHKATMYYTETHSSCRNNSENAYSRTNIAPPKQSPPTRKKPCPLDLQSLIDTILPCGFPELSPSCSASS
ncbi:Hypothetical protein PYTT_2135 [Akkermansia glycaniphila]|uniref:Uncharacterized protein n=1 Tax=Akkermansia glycaniphila TaxID=1679444 RepID=A0A1H6M579_9BACT|nr:Hypothetical protein PYTT_2135 [Akkermansia glycaniphila]